MNDAAFDTLLSYMEDELSFATSHYNDSYLDRRISSRIRRTGAADYADYLDLLRDDAAEQEALLESMSINVTEFFRNSEVWERLRDVLRALAADSRRLRIWSAPCADGREPYSLAMLALDDPEIDAADVRITGSDISEPALDIARQGIYQSSSTVDIAEQLSFLRSYDRYVDVDDDTFEVTDEVRELVTFERYDLINDPPKSGADFDLVMCRNLFIYIDNEYKEPILDTIVESMRPEAYLVIGKAETIPTTHKSVLDTYDSKSRIYRLGATD